MAKILRLEALRVKGGKETAADIRSDVIMSNDRSVPYSYLCPYTENSKFI